MQEARIAPASCAMDQRSVVVCGGWRDETDLRSVEVYSLLHDDLPDDLILITSFGSGAGSDSFVLKATELLPARRDRAPTVTEVMDRPKRYLTYGEYAKYREKIILND